MRLFLILFILAASSLDAGFTLYGMHYNIITEANPLMNGLLQFNQLAFLLLKISLPLLLLFLVPKLISRRFKQLLVLTSFIYCCVLSLHGVWLVEALG